jgi:hypothetical protein
MSKSNENVTVKKINWDEVVSRTEKAYAIPKKTTQETFEGVAKTLRTIMKDERPTEVNGVTIIKTPIAAFCERYVGAHQITDENGDKYEVSDAIGITATPPLEWSQIANEGFKLTSKKI